MSDDAKADCLAGAMKHAEGLDEVPLIYICQGKPRCTVDHDNAGPPQKCPWCVVIRADDPRDPDEIIAAMGVVQ
jgi:hypothetical protein